MTTTHIAAYSEMCAAVRDAVASSALTVGYAIELRYADQTYAARPPTDKIWARFTQVAAGERKRTLSQPPRVTYTGQAMIDLFVPTTQKNGAKLARQVAGFLSTAYFARLPNVWFTRVLPFKDMGKEDQWFFLRGAATYTYDVYEGTGQ